MSTYFYAACLDHDPPLVATEESGQHFWNDESRATFLRCISQRDFLVDLYDNGEAPSGSYFLGNTIRFLSQHRTCKLVGATEYGQWFDVGWGVPEGEVDILKEKNEY